MHTPIVSHDKICFDDKSAANESLSGKSPKYNF